MGKLFKLIVFLGVAGVLAGGGSYAAAYFTQGKITGVDDPLGPREWRLAWQGYDSLPGKPRAWVFTYPRPRVTGVSRATIVVGLNGDLLLAKPADLAERVERWRAQRQSVD
jgi:hypothetical protein